MSLRERKWTEDKKKWRGKTIKELREEVTRLKSEQFNQRFARATGKLENFRALPKTRKELAILLTLIHEKELAAAAGKESK